MYFSSSSSQSPSRWFQVYGGSAAVVLAGVCGATATAACGDVYCSMVHIDQSYLSVDKTAFPLNLTTHVAPIFGKDFKLGEAQNRQAQLLGLAGRMVFERYDMGDTTSKKFIVVDALVRSPSIFMMRPPVEAGDEQPSMSYPAQIDFATVEAQSHKQAVFSILLSVDDECSADLAPAQENVVIKALVDDEYTPDQLQFAHRSSATLYPGFASSDFIVKHKCSFTNVSHDPVNNYYLGGVVLTDPEMRQLVEKIAPGTYSDVVLGQPDAVAEYDQVSAVVPLDSALTPTLYRHPYPDETAVKIHSNVSSLPGSHFIEDALKACQPSAEPARELQPVVIEEQADVYGIDVITMPPMPTEPPEEKSGFNWVLFILVPCLCIGIVAALYCCFFYARRSRRPN